jgi:A/G-specific adenine glycosylase
MSLLRSRLLAWYERERRDLPWRCTEDPYAIWISEIMLQQTRVAAVLGRYEAFLARFPNVQTLAGADVFEVLAQWSGLGYYRRARALHGAARRIVSAGAFPTTSAGWRDLPGIGRYTAAAIASIAFGEVVAVVDGNVERVVRRLLGAASAPGVEIWAKAEELLSRRRPGDFNQAMMELGATVCTPARPRCEECPLYKMCGTRGELPSKPAVKRLRRDSTYALRVRAGSVYLKQRGGGESLMPGMWELPEVAPEGHAPEFTLRHSITVTDYRIAVVRTGSPMAGGRWVKNAEVTRLPLTGLARKILRRAGII